MVLSALMLESAFTLLFALRFSCLPDAFVVGSF